MGKQQNQGDRLNIAVLIGRINLYTDLVFFSMAEYAKQKNINLIILGGKQLVLSPGKKFSPNIIYQLARGENIHGVIVLASYIGQYISPEELDKFCQQFSPKPVVIIGEEIEGFSSITVDNSKGLYDLICHLIDVHDRYRIAFVNGPVDSHEAKTRFETYQQVLRDRGIPFDPDLVVPGGFHYRFGRIATEELLQRGVDFDAVVSANDATAWGVLDYLRKRGIHVPYQAAVIGFDDYAESRYSIPPLSTVRQPRRELGIQAINIIIDELSGINDLQHHQLKSEMVLRQSCGCLAPTTNNIKNLKPGAENDIPKISDKLELIARRDIIRKEFLQTLKDEPFNDLPLVGENIERLFEALFQEIESEKTGEFLKTFDYILHQTVEKEENLDFYYRVLLSLWSQVLKHLKSDYELIEQLEFSWQQAHTNLANTIQYAQHNANLTQLRTELFFEINEDVITAFDFPKLVNTLQEAFRQLDIQYGFLCLSGDLGETQSLEKLPDWSRLIMGYVDGETLLLDTEGIRFPTDQILPEEILQTLQRYEFYILPLRFQDHYLGHAVFEVDRRLEFVYDALQIQISGAIQGALLIDQLSQARDELELRVEDRTAELQREIAERNRVEKILRENEKRYRALFEQTTDAVFIFDLDTQHIMVNQRAADMLGYTVDEMVGMPGEKIVAPDEFEQALNKLEMARQGKPIPLYERKLIHKDGHLVPAEINLSLVTDADGNPLHFQSIVRDITDRKRSDRVMQALNSASLAMRQAITPEEIFEAAGGELKARSFECAIFRTNYDLSSIIPQYLSFDKEAVAAAADLLGISAEDHAIQIESLNVLKEVVWEQKTVLVNDFCEAVSPLLPDSTKDVDKHLIELLIIPCSIVVPLIVDQQMMGVISIHSEDLTLADIPNVTFFANQVATTWQKVRLMQDLELSLVAQLHTEESLRKSEEKFRTLFELSPQAIVLVGMNGIIIDANEAVENILGSKRSEIIGQPFVDLAFWNEEQQRMPGYNELLSQATRGKPIKPVEIQFNIREGESRWIELHTSLLKEGNDIPVLQIIIWDITDRRKAEQATQQRVDELEAIYLTSLQLANASLNIGEIAQIAVHRLKNVMEAGTAAFTMIDFNTRKLKVIVDTISEREGKKFLTQGDVIAFDDYPFTGQILETANPIIIDADNPEILPTESNYLQESNLTTLVIIPLSVKSHKIGFLELQSVQAYHYTPSQLNLAMALANQIAVTLDNARLFEAAQQEIFERIQAEIALQESEEQFRSIFENAVMGFYRSTPCGTILMANPALIRMLGYESFEELAERDLGVNGFAEEAPRSEFIRRLEAEGQVIGFEAIWMKKDNTLLYVQESAKVIYDNNGKVTFYEGTVEDISQRKQIEALQRISEERFNKAFNISPLAMGIQGMEGDQRGSWLLINNAFSEVTGYSRSEVLGHTNNELKLYAHPKEQETAINLFWEQGYVHEFEFEFRRKSGELRYGLLWSEATQVGDEQNVLVLIQDITDKKKAERERQNLINFQQLVAMLSARFINLSNVEIEKEITYALKIITEYAQVDAGSVWMFSSDKTTGSKVFGWPNPDKKERNQNVLLANYAWMFEQLLEGKVISISSKAAFLSDDVSRIFADFELLAVMAIPLITEGDVIGALIIYMRNSERRWSDELESLLKIIGDIIVNALERKRAEESIRQLNEELELRVIQRTQQLAAANTELEAFAYSVSHDLRAPLRAIDGFSLALLEDYNDQLDEIAKNYLQRVRAASQRMGHLIDDLLKLSRVTRSEMVHDQVNLSILVARIFDELQETEPNRAVELRIQPDLVTVGDEHLLHIMLTNLCSNAWKFTSKKECAQIEFGCLDEKGSQAFFIRDNGAGFDMTYFDKLFGTFQRLHSVQDFEGTGIGLATVKRIVQRHGGRIWAEGEVGQGAAFYFTLG